MNHYIQSASHDFKLFEMNDIAKYGIMTMTSKVLSPLQYKSLMYLIWKNLQKTPGQIEFDMEKPAENSRANRLCRAFTFRAVFCTGILQRQKLQFFSHEKEGRSCH